MTATPDPGFTYSGSVLEPFLERNGGVLRSHVRASDNGAFRDDFEMFGAHFVLNRSHYRNGMMVFHVDEQGISYSLWGSLVPFNGDPESSDDLITHIENSPKFEQDSDFLLWLLERIPEYLALPPKRRHPLEIDKFEV